MPTGFHNEARDEILGYRRTRNSLSAHVFRVSSLLSCGIADPCLRGLLMQSNISCEWFIVLLQVTVAGTWGTARSL
jgi:hypothetical protein